MRIMLDTNVLISMLVFKSFNVVIDKITQRHSTFAGILKETDSGYSFVYNSEYLADENSSAISLILKRL